MGTIQDSADRCETCCHLAPTTAQRHKMCFLASSVSAGLYQACKNSVMLWCFSQTRWYLHWSCSYLSAAVQEAVVEGQVAQAQPELRTRAHSTDRDMSRTPSVDSQDREAARPDSHEGTSDRAADTEAVEAGPKGKGRAKDHKLPPGGLLAPPALFCRCSEASSGMPPLEPPLQPAA